MNGVIFVATGLTHVAWARSAAKSVREHCPGLPIDLFTDQPEAADHDFDVVHRIESPHIRSKVDLLYKTRFSRTLYLDTDVRLVSDIREAFQVLDRFDIALAHAHTRNREATKSTWRTPIPDAFPQLNSGVILYRSTPPVLRLLEDWGAAYRSAGFKKDQVTLRELLWLSDLRIHVLPPEYNIRHQKYLAIWEKEEAVPRVLHFREFRDREEMQEQERAQKQKSPLELSRPLQEGAGSLGRRILRLVDAFPWRQSRNKASDVILNQLAKKPFNELRAALPNARWAKYLDFDRFVPFNIALCYRLKLDKVPLGTILDIGCGSGLFLYCARYFGHEGLGIDVEDPLLARMATLLNIERRIARVDAFKPVAVDGRFDLITCINTVFDRPFDTKDGAQHNWSCEEWRFFLADIGRKLKPQGRVFLRINRGKGGKKLGLDYYDAAVHRALEHGHLKGIEYLFDRDGLARAIQNLGITDRTGD